MNVNICVSYVTILIYIFLGHAQPQEDGLLAMCMYHNTTVILLLLLLLLLMLYIIVHASVENKYF